jgi:hypothetical protein
MSQFPSQRLLLQTYASHVTLALTKRVWMEVTRSMNHRSQYLLSLIPHPYALANLDIMNMEINAHNLNRGSMGS